MTEEQKKLLEKLKTTKEKLITFKKNQGKKYIEILPKQKNNTK